MRRTRPDCVADQQRHRQRRSALEFADRSAARRKPPQVLSTTNYLNTSNVPLSAGATSDSKMEQDNQKLFSLYNAVNTLSQLAQMAQSSTATSGQLAGYNTRFQTGLCQIEQYLGSTTFNNFNLEAATPSNKVTSTADVADQFEPDLFHQAAGDQFQVNNAVPGVSSSDSFTIAVRKDGTTTNVPIDLSQVQGTLNLNNIVTYINSQLSADGFQTRFQKTEAGGTATSDTNATYGLQIIPGGAEQVSLSAASTPALYVAGNSGLATETNTTINSATSQVNTTPADQSGRLTKLSARSAARPRPPSASTSRPPAAPPRPSPRWWIPAATSM